jgi:hypothetical protein
VIEIASVDEINERLRVDTVDENGREASITGFSR